MGSISHHIMPLVINSLRVVHAQLRTHTHTPHTFTDIYRQNNFKIPGACQVWLAHTWFNNNFYNSIILCLQVIMHQMFYIIFVLHQNVTVGPRRHIISGVTVAEHACSSYTIKNDNGSEVCSPVNSLRGISEYYSMSHLLYYLCIHLDVEVLFEPK